jgi:hypothetical protein
MDRSLLLARLIGPLLVLVGVGVLFNRQHYATMMQRFLQNTELYYFSGVLAFLVGEVFILYHNLWVWDWRVVLTLIGWLSLLKGTMRIAFPVVGLKIAKSFAESGRYLNVGAILIVAFGAWLVYQGFGTGPGT